MKKVVCLVLLSALVLGLPKIFSAFAQAPSDDLQAAIEQLQQQISDLQDQIADLKAQLITIKLNINFKRDLRRGMSGQDIKQIQEFLRLFPQVYPEGLVTGYYGKLTESAIKRFQEAFGLEETGIANAETRNHLQESISAEIKSRQGKKQPQAIASSAPIVMPTAASTTSTSSVPATTSSTLTDLTDLTDLGITDTFDMSYASETSPETGLYTFDTSANTTLPSSTATSSNTITVSSSTTTTTTTTTTATTTLTISNVSATNIQASSVKITWQTNVLSDSEVYYGLTTSYSSSTTNSSLVTDHSISLSNLKKATTYHFHVESKDAQRNIATSNDQMFTTSK